MSIVASPVHSRARCGFDPPGALFADEHAGSVVIMRLLVLGGTSFVGWAFVEAALAAGHHVTTFNRGRTGADVPGVEVVHGDREVVSDLARLAAQGPWDAVFDTSGYVPAVVGATVRVLGDRFGRYVFVSTVGAYRHWPAEPVTEQSERWSSDPDESSGTVSTYGRLKAGCELAVERVAGRDRTVVLRPGPILGPRDNPGRLPWWLERCARGGQILAPGPADRPIQPVDVRDLAAFALTLASRGGTGAFNVAAPVGHATFGELLDACVSETRRSRAISSEAELVWADPDWLAGQGLRPWTELPLWRTEPGTWAVGTTRAEQAGLACRPLTTTVAATWQWMITGDVAGDERWKENGIDPARERQLLSTWQAERR